MLASVQGFSGYAWALLFENACLEFALSSED